MRQVSLLFPLMDPLKNWQKMVSLREYFITWMFSKPKFINREFGTRDLSLVQSIIIVLRILCMVLHFILIHCVVDKNALPISHININVQVAYLTFYCLYRACLQNYLTLVASHYHFWYSIMFICFD